MSARNAAAHENLLVAVMSASAGLVFLDRYGLAYAFPTMRTELGLSNAQLGSLMSATAIAWAISSILCSWTSDRLGGRSRSFVVLSMLLFSLATGLTSLVDGYRGLLAIRILLGALEGPVIPLMTASMLAASSPGRRGVNLGIVIAGVSLFGFALPPLVLTALIEHFGWRQAFFIIALPGVVLSIVLAGAMRGIVLGPDDRDRVDFTFPVLARIIGQRSVLLAILGGGALIGAGITFASFAPSVLIAPGGLTSVVAGRVLAVYGLLGTAGTVIAPALSDRLGRKSILLASSLLAIALPVGVIYLREQPAALTGLMALQLLAGGALALFVYVIPGEAVPKALTATTFALVLAIGEIVDGSIGPWLAGILSDRYGLDASMWTCAALTAIGLAAALALRSQPLPLRRGTRDPGTSDGMAVSSTEAAQRI